MKGLHASRWVPSKKIVKTDLFREIPIYQRLYSTPFLVIYGIWLVGWIKLCRMEAVPSWLIHKEFYLIPLFLIISTQFILFMSRFWSVSADSWLSYRKVTSLKDAQKMLVCPNEQSGKASLCTLKYQDSVAYFIFQQRKFVYDQNKNIFVKLKYPESEHLKMYKDSNGISANAAQSLCAYYERNEFNIPIPTFAELWKEHAVAPFFVFQIFCVGLWLLDDYWYYSLFTLLMLCVFESTVVYQRLRNIKDFQTMSVPVMELQVKRGGKWFKIASSELLPGDLCLLSFDPEKEMSVPCDLLLLSGSVIVNEAMLSGESTPLLKENIFEVGDDDRSLDLKSEHRNNILFGGTKIMQITSSENESKYDPRTFYYSYISSHCRK